MKKLKINTSLEPMDEWTYETYVSDYIFENTEFHCSKENHMYPHHRWEWETKPLCHLQKWD